MAERSSLIITAQTPLDEDFFLCYQAANQQVGEVPPYELLMLPDKKREQISEAFFAEPDSDPDLRPHHVSVEALKNDEEVWRDFKATVAKDKNTDPQIAQLYLWAVNEKIAGLRMVRAAHEGNQSAFDVYNRFIYSEPKSSITKAVIDWFGTVAEEKQVSDHASVRQAAKAVIEAMPNARGNREHLIPSSDTFKQIYDQHWRRGGFYTLVLAGIELPDKGPITPDIGEPVLMQVRQNLHATDYERVKTDSTTWSVSHRPKELRGPGEYKMPLGRWIGLPIGHEWGSHVTEAINGKRSAIRLLGTGIDRYEMGNEGRAVIREQVAYDSFEEFSGLLRWQDIMRRHLAVSLGAGALGSRLRFSEVFSCINAIDRLWERNKKPNEPEEADKKADNRSMSLLLRVLKGTDGTGGAFYKDKIYLEGNVACWDTARTQPHLIEMGDRGKFDITQPRHVKPVEKAGVFAV